jgi:hypothetical protein
MEFAVPKETSAKKLSALRRQVASTQGSLDELALRVDDIDGNLTSIAPVLRGCKVAQCPTHSVTTDTHKT